MAYVYTVLTPAQQTALLAAKKLELEKEHYLLTRALLVVQAQPETHERNAEINRINADLTALEKGLSAL
jgi:hypothetical protein